jgi:hypothetical protein
MNQWESEAGSAFTPLCAKSSAASSGMGLSGILCAGPVARSRLNEAFAE